MSYGDTFVSAFSAGADIRDRRKKMKMDTARDQAERDLKLDLAARDAAVRKDLQTTAQTFQAGEGDKDRTFRTGERVGTETFQAGQGDKERTFRTGEREAGQGFQGVQATLERAARALGLDKELAARATTALAEHGLRKEQLGWQKDPANPGNKAQEAYAKMTLANLPQHMSGMQDDATAGTPSFDSSAEGREVLGPDGKTYVIKNGMPVLKK